LYLEVAEWRLLIGYLVEFRNALIMSVDELLVKVIYARTVKVQNQMIGGKTNGKDIFEQLGDTYERHGDYLIPCLTLPTEKEKLVGIYGQRHLWYLKKYRNALLFCKSVPFSSSTLEKYFQSLPQNYLCSGYKKDLTT